ncbi:MAG: hypothetical protein TRG1_1865 [Flavobacteriaceae bacterium FS1-H7996/R]|nr:MAG: hypothetical protein TRG1_1865 [Flavobacteriaceae bacterium FS1-H7996/R]
MERKNNPVGYFSERASLRKGYFRLQTKRLNHFKIKKRYQTVTL